MRRTVSRFFWLTLGFFPWPAAAALVSLNSVADTSLLEVAPGDNNGGEAWMISGTTQNGPSARALFRFDITSIPTNAVIRSNSLVLTVTHQPRDGYDQAPFGVFRMFRDWGEGNKTNPVNPGQGAPASPGEATWLYRFYPTNGWDAPGGAFTTDVSRDESSSTEIYGAGVSYTFPSTPELIADVQEWVSHLASNFGWMLRCDDEGLIFTARRFGSHEDPDNHPVLIIDYIVPPRIDQIKRLGGQFILTFTVSADQTYVVQSRDSLSAGSWQTLTNLGSFAAPSSLSVTDNASLPQRFYRVMTY